MDDIFKYLETPGLHVVEQRLIWPIPPKVVGQTLFQAFRNGLWT